MVHIHAFRFSPGQGRCASAATAIRRPRTGRETSRNSAKRREPVINQNCRPETVLGRFRRSAEQVGVPCQGEGRGFESRRPLHVNPLHSRGF